METSPAAALLSTPAATVVAGRTRRGPVRAEQSAVLSPRRESLTAFDSTEPEPTALLPPGEMRSGPARPQEPDCHCRSETTQIHQKNKTQVFPRNPSPLIYIYHYSPIMSPTVLLSCLTRMPFPTLPPSTLSVTLPYISAIAGLVPATCLDPIEWDTAHLYCTPFFYLILKVGRGFAGNLAPDRFSLSHTPDPLTPCLCAMAWPVYAQNFHLPHTRP